jgi:hypothetical protein
MLLRDLQRVAHDLANVQQTLEYVFLMNRNHKPEDPIHEPARIKDMAAKLRGVVGLLDPAVRTSHKGARRATR